MDPSNYRPVSLTSVVSKLMESVIRDLLMGHLITNNLISKKQHGFVPKRSCVTNLLTTLNKWHQILDEGGTVDAVYLDFQKAFDTVPH